MIEHNGRLYIAPFWLRRHPRQKKKMHPLWLPFIKRDVSRPSRMWRLAPSIVPWILSRLSFSRKVVLDKVRKTVKVFPLPKRLQALRLVFVPWTVFASWDRPWRSFVRFPWWTRPISMSNLELCRLRLRFVLPFIVRLSRIQRERWRTWHQPFKMIPWMAKNIGLPMPEFAQRAMIWFGLFD
jgi:hypothetical protein